MALQEHLISGWDASVKGKGFDKGCGRLELRRGSGPWSFPRDLSPMWPADGREDSSSG
jgi:hypothetical protein